MICSGTAPDEFQLNLHTNCQGDFLHPEAINNTPSLGDSYRRRETISFLLSRKKKHLVRWLVVDTSNLRLEDKMTRPMSMAFANIYHLMIFVLPKLIYRNKYEFLREKHIPPISSLSTLWKMRNFKLPIAHFLSRWWSPPTAFNWKCNLRPTASRKSNNLHGL